MTTAYSPLLGLALPVTGELSGTWGTTVNNYITSFLDSAVSGTQTLSSDLDVTLTVTNGTALGSTSSQYAVLLCSGVRSAIRNITAPAQSKTYVVINSTTGGFAVNLRGAGPTTGVQIAAGEYALCAWNGTDFIKISGLGGSGTFTSLTATGAITFNTTTNNQSYTTTGAGAITMSSGTTGSINNMSIGATTASTGKFTALTNTALTSGRVVYSTTGGLETDSANLTFDGTSLTLGGNPTLSAGTANGVLYLNGSKVATSGSALTFDGTIFTAPQVRTTNVTGAIFNTATGAYSQWQYNAAAVGDIGTANNVIGSGATTDFGITSRGASGNLVFGVNNAEQMRLTSTGLGIGTSSPGAKLDVNGASILRGNIQNFAGQWIGNSAGASYLPDDGVVGGSIRNGGSFFITTGGAERLRIDATGNLGIGTSSPNQKLTVVGGRSYFGANAETYSIGVGYNGTRTAASQTYFVGATDSATPSLVLSNVNGNATATLTHDGNLGLGVTPSAWSGLAPALQLSRMSLVPSATTSNDVYLNSNAYYNAGWKYIGTGTATQFASNAVGDFRFYVAPSGTAGTAISFTQAMTLDASGNLGVGTTSPSSYGKFAVTGSLATTYINDQGIALIFTRTGDNYIVANNGNINYAAGTHVFTNSAQTTEYARIDSSGNLLVGTTTSTGQLTVQSAALVARFTRTSAGGIAQFKNGSDAGYGIDLLNVAGTSAGSIYWTATTTTYATSSDERLKENIVDAPDASSIIDGIKIRSFDWKADGSHQRFGVIAQEIEQVAPEAVGRPAGDEDGFLGVDYSKLVPMLIKEVQALRARVAQLEAKG